MPALDKSCRVRLMTNPKVATTVAKLQQEADAAVVQERIASREEVLQTLTGYMHSGEPGEPGDSVKLRAAELMGKHYGLFTDRIEAVKPPRSSEEIQLELEAPNISLVVAIPAPPASGSPSEA